MIDFKDWIDLNNVEHIKSILHLFRHGFWPENFIPDDVNVTCNMYPDLTSKIVLNWINEKQVDILFKEGL